MAGVTTSLSNTGFSLLMRCLTCNPVARISAAEALKQRWFQQRPVAEALASQRLQELAVAAAAAAAATQAATQATQMAQMAAAAAAAAVNPQAQMAAKLAAAAAFSGMQAGMR